MKITASIIDFNEARLEALARRVEQGLGEISAAPATPRRGRWLDGERARKARKAQRDSGFPREVLFLR